MIAGSSSGVNIQKEKDMELNDWLTILGALGGLEAIKWEIIFYVDRKTNARKDVSTSFYV